MSETNRGVQRVCRAVTSHGAETETHIFLKGNKADFTLKGAEVMTAK